MDFVALSLAKAYTDSQRLAYEEDNVVEVMALTEIEIEAGYADGIDFPNIEHMEAGNTALVVWDGISYTCIITGSSNRAFIGRNDGGVPFYLSINKTRGELEIQIDGEWFYPGVITHTLQISVIAGTKPKRIDPRYLPEGGVGYMGKGKTVLVPEHTYTSDLGDYRFEIAYPAPDSIVVILDGVTYECKADDNGVCTRYHFGIEPFYIEIYRYNGSVSKVAFLTDLSDDNQRTLEIYTMDFETPHPIDQKFIPALDSLTLNGADGKQYKLTVDKNGALVHTVIE